MPTLTSGESFYVLNLWPINMIGVQASQAMTFFVALNLKRPVAPIHHPTARTISPLPRLLKA
jgi:hypothetical protein